MPPAVKPEDRRRSPLGIAYVGEQSPHPVEPQRDPGRVSRAETVNGAGRRRPDVRCERKSDQRCQDRRCSSHCSSETRRWK